MGFRDAWNSVFDMLFRLFPHRSPPGLIAVGHPGPDAPVLLTGNYTLTVRRLKRALAGEDAWLLSADSKGINVWCAAGGGHLTHHDVIAAIRTSGVGERVARHRLILPQLSATGVERRHITAATGWEALWGPARLEDLPAYLHRGGEVHRRERLMRFPLRERMEMAFMWVWPIVALGAPAVAWLANGPIALAFALMAPALVFGLFAALPWLRVSGRARWLTFAAAAACGFAGGAALLAVLGALSAGGLVWMAGGALLVMAILSADLAGTTPWYGSYINLWHNEARIDLVEDLCTGQAVCVQVCPRGVLAMQGARHKVAIERPDDCIQCGACIVQCPEDALRFRYDDGRIVEPATIRTTRMNMVGRRTVAVPPAPPAC